MRAVVATGPHEYGVIAVDDPVPDRDEVVLEVLGCGICGTDLHLLSGDLGSDRFPLIPGHEPWGRVVEVGPDARGVVPGDLVAVDPSLHCGQCSRCRRGRGNMCENWGAIGATRAGAWAEYLSAPAANLHPIPPEMPQDLAPLVEPVACAIRGLQRLDPHPDEPAIVFGAGTMGLVLAILLEARGAGPVTIVDSNPARRQTARLLTGASVLGPDEVQGVSAPAVIDATGNPAAIEQALECVDRAGTLLIFGVASPSARATVSPYRIYADELTILGSMAILRSFAPAVDAVTRHSARLAPLVTHTVGLDQIERGVAAVATGEAVKVVVTPDWPGVTT